MSLSMAVRNLLEPKCLTGNSNLFQQIFQGYLNIFEKKTTSRSDMVLWQWEVSLVSYSVSEAGLSGYVGYFYYYSYLFLTVWDNSYLFLWRQSFSLDVAIQERKKSAVHLLLLCYSSGYFMPVLPLQQWDMCASLKKQKTLWRAIRP